MRFDRVDNYRQRCEIEDDTRVSRTRNCRLLSRICLLVVNSIPCCTLVCYHNHRHLYLLETFIRVSPSRPTRDTTQLQNRILDGRTSKATSRRARYGHGRRSWRPDCSSGQVSFSADYSTHHADILMHYSGETVHISALALLKVGMKCASVRGVSLMVLSLTNRCSNMVERAFQWRLWA